MLPPEVTQQAVQRQTVLQPLKFAHFERRALHMATQLLESSRRWVNLVAVCRTAVVRGVPDLSLMLAG